MRPDNPGDKSLPPGWDAFSLGSKASFVTSGSRGWARYYTETGDLFLRSQNVRSGRLDLEDRQHVLPPAGAEGERTRVQPNDLLVTITGNSVGNVAISSDDLGIAYISQHVGLIRLVNPSLAPYACWYLSPGAPGNRQIMDAQTGQSKPGLNLQNLKDLVVAAPKDKRERDLIVTALDDIQAQADEMQMLLSKKRMLKQAAMQELLTGKRRLPGVEGEWEVKRLWDIADIDPESLGAGTLPDFHFNYISLEDVVHGNLRSYSEQVIESAPSRARRRLRQNDILVSTVRPNLLSHLLFGESGDRWVASTGFSVARCMPGMAHPGYVFAHLFADGMNRQIEALLTGSNYPAINSRDVRALEIPLPPYPEQCAIADVFSDIGSELSALEARSDKTRELKQGMMQELLTGRIRLT